MEPFSNVPGDAPASMSTSHRQNNVEKEHVQRGDNDSKDERRARILARVYSYLLDRATELETGERSSQPAMTVREVKVTDQSDDVSSE